LRFLRQLRSLHFLRCLRLMHSLHCVCCVRCMLCVEWKPHFSLHQYHSVSFTLYNCYIQEKFRQILEIHEMVGGALDDTNPNRELIKEGKITKISARDGAHLERYLFLVLCLFACMQNFLHTFN